MNTWDVVLLRFPFNDGDTGVKIRPALVVSRNEYHNAGQDALFIPITSNIQRQAEYDILIDGSNPEFGLTGLAKPSAIRVDKMMNLSKAMVSRQLGMAGPGIQASVKA